MFFDPNHFEFVSLLESNWLLIQREFEQLHRQHLIQWPEKFLCPNGWEVFGLYAYGQKLEDNCHLCPQTTQLVERIPGMFMAGLSLLKPGTHILPHNGYENGVLRCHLGLIIPEECAIRVNNQIQKWQPGKCLIFDDTVEHEAWNYGTSERTILLIDFQAQGANGNQQSRFNYSPEIAEMLRTLTHP